MSQHASKRLIFIWTHPRALSTVLLLSLAQLKNVRTAFEPFCDAWYFGPDRQTQRCLSRTDGPTITGVMQDVLIATRSLPDNGVFIVKDMAYALVMQPHVKPSQRYSEFCELVHQVNAQHVFLVRDPRRSIPSLYNACMDPAVGWKSFDPTECGYDQLLQVYKHVKTINDIEPVVIDSDDLATNPREMLQQLCLKTGMTFDTCMMTWEIGKRDDWANWSDGWFKEVSGSKGWITDKSPTTKPFPALDSYPDQVRQCIEECIPVYHELIQHKLKL